MKYISFVPLFLKWQSSHQVILNIMACNNAEECMDNIATNLPKRNTYQFKSLVTGISSRMSTILFVILLIIILLIGWQDRHESHLNAEEGLGYGLGIIGGVMMLVLMLYPLRKRYRFMRIFGSVKHWFRAHMLLGIFGPVCVIFHANFQLGSLNSNVALFCMLLVAFSGVIGRYFYSRIHVGLYGGKATLEELKQVSHIMRMKFTDGFEHTPEIDTHLEAIEGSALMKGKGFFRSIAHLFLFRLRLQWEYFLLMRIVRRALKDAKLAGSCREERLKYKQNAKRYLSVYLATLRMVSGLQFYERLFSLWHVLHLPLFLMMLVSGVVHTFAVHMY